MYRPSRLILVLLLAAVPAFFLLRAGPDNLQRALEAGDYSLDQLVAEYLPFSEELTRFGLDIRLLSGQKEQNGIFISKEGLMRNLKEPAMQFSQENAAALSEFAERYMQSGGSIRRNTYLAVIPTASGVQQQKLPPFAQGEVIDQQRLIEEIYNQTSGIRTIDIYSALSARSSQYIYYRTDTGLTSLGGYYAYSAIAARLEISNRSLGQFDIEYLDYDYYGNLYRATDRSLEIAPYRKVKPDKLALYHYSGNREYVMTQSTPDGVQVHHTLYPKQHLQLGSELEVYLGGSAGVTEITSSAPYRGTLLVFGDETAASYLPFLVNHYGRVTLVNLYQASQSELAAIQPAQYDQVLFAYGIESLIHTRNPASVKAVTWESVP